MGPYGEVASVLQNLGPIHPARTFWRAGDDAVDHGGVERAVGDLASQCASRQMVRRLRRQFLHKHRRTTFPPPPVSAL
jgi:hypothetical protein